MKIMKVRQPNGIIVDIPIGRGTDGKTAYQYAQEGGYTGTAAEFSTLLANTIDKRKITLGLYTDGLIYLFIDGLPVGNGIALPSGGVSGDIVGNVDSANNIVLMGNLADGTYTVKYEMENGSTVNIGTMVLDTNVYYTITKNLTNCSISNSATSVIKDASYSATISADYGYELKSVSVTMGGSPVTVSGGVINISNVTGNIVITAVAEEAQAAETVTENIAILDNTSIVTDTGADRADTAPFVATQFIDVSNIPKPCVIHLKTAKWSNASTSEAGYVRFYVADKSGTKLAGGYTHPSYMPSGVTMELSQPNPSDAKHIDATVTITSDNIGKLRFAAAKLVDPNNDSVYLQATATLTYTSNGVAINNLAQPDATATGEAAWNSGGWCNNSYMAGSSYAYRSATDGRLTTNTIAVEYGDTIYVKGIDYASATYPQVAVFDASGAKLSHGYAQYVYNNGYINELSASTGSDYWSFTITSGSGDRGVRFVRFAGYPSGDISDIIITRNQPIEGGGSDEPTTQTYTITSNLTNCTSNNSATTVDEGSAYNATITADDGYELKSVTVTMGGSAVSVSGGVINIASVTGDIIITAEAEEKAVGVEPTNFFDASQGFAGRLSSSGADRTDSPASFVTNYVPVQVGDTIKISGCTVAFKLGSLYAFMTGYNSGKTNVYTDSSRTSNNYWTFDTMTSTEAQITVLDSNIAYLRFACADPTFYNTALTANSNPAVDTSAIVINIKRNGEWL